MNLAYRLLSLIQIKHELMSQTGIYNDAGLPGLNNEILKVTYEFFRCKLSSDTFSNTDDRDVNFQKIFSL